MLNFQKQQVSEEPRTGFPQASPSLPICRLREGCGHYGVRCTWWKLCVRYVIGLSGATAQCTQTLTTISTAINVNRNAATKPCTQLWAGALMNPK